MSKAKLFIENFVIYGIGGVVSRIIPLIMVPIVTRLMPNTVYFGISDMSQTIISFCGALAIIGMYDAMYRMFFEKEDELYKKSVCSTALFFTIGTSIIVFLLMFFMKKQMAKYFLGNKDYFYVIYISAMATLVTATNSIIAAPTRMQNKRIIYLIVNTIAPLVSYGIAIPLLLNGYYVIALPLASLLSGTLMELCFFIINRKWFHWSFFDIALLKQLLIIAIPLFPNFIIYWIFNSSDRLMIANLMDVGAEGIYSVGSKLGHASQLIYTAFVGGWQFFAFSTMNEKNQVKTNSFVFEYLGIISFVVTSLMCACSYTIYKVLFVGDYVDGFIIAPYLFLAPLLQMLFQVACNQFIVIKKTWPNMLILMSGAILNMVINYFLIPVIGIEGAAIATLVGYVVSDIIAVVVLEKMNLLNVRLRFVIASFGMLVVLLLWRFFADKNIVLGLCIFISFTVLVVCLYKDELKRIVQKISSVKSYPIGKT